MMAERDAVPIVPRDKELKDKWSSVADFVPVNASQYSFDTRP